jgi:NTP pyrophosphatase (non-canonical NTP hydrolase)
MEMSEFVVSFNAVQLTAFNVNKANGWWNERWQIQAKAGEKYTPHLAIELLGLAHTELSEAIEAARKHPIEQWSDAKTKDTMVRELAGCVVRLMDMSEHFGLPLAQAIEEEIEANRSRGYMHGGRKT